MTYPSHTTVSYEREEMEEMISDEQAILRTTVVSYQKQVSINDTLLTDPAT